MLQSCLLCETVPPSVLEAARTLLILNSASEPFVKEAAHSVMRHSDAHLWLVEDNVAVLRQVLRDLGGRGSQPGSAIHSAAFHSYLLHNHTRSADLAILNLLYQSGSAWSRLALQIARATLQPSGRLYVIGPKDRGIISFGKRMAETFGNVETLAISKGWRVLLSEQVSSPVNSVERNPQEDVLSQLLPGSDISIFAGGKLDEGTRLLLESLEVRATDEALDLGSGAGYLGLSIASQAPQGRVTLIDASLAAVEAAQLNAERLHLSNVEILPGDGAQQVLDRSFDLVVTNPPFHQGGIQTLEIAERFIREAAQVLRPHGRLYLVANRFLKYEPTLRSSFRRVEEVGGNSRYKVIRADTL